MKFTKLKEATGKILEKVVDGSDKARIDTLLGLGWKKVAEKVEKKKAAGRPKKKK